MYCLGDSVWPVSCNIVDAVPSFFSDSACETANVHTDSRQFYAFGLRRNTNVPTNFLYCIHFCDKNFLIFQFSGKPVTKRRSR